MNRYSFIVFAIILLLTTVNCRNERNRYNYLSNEVSKALEKGHADDMLPVTEKIKKDYIYGKDGLKYLKLKISTLCFTGKYREAIELIAEFRNIFPDNIELIAAQGLLATWINEDGNVYIHKSLELLSGITIEKKEKSEKVLEYYLLTFVDGMDVSERKDVLRNSMKNDALTIIDYYEQISREELVSSPPVGFITKYKMPYKSDSDKEEWWKEQ